MSSGLIVMFTASPMRITTSSVDVYTPFQGLSQFPENFCANIVPAHCKFRQACSSLLSVHKACVLLVQARSARCHLLSRPLLAVF